MIEFISIERIGKGTAACYQAILWGADLEKLAHGAGVSAQAALQNAIGVLGRKR